MNYDAYHIFYVVAKCKNITQAAKHLSASQPNLTRTIKNLEQDLGCQLFIRKRYGVELTPEGEKLYKHAAIAFEHLTMAQKEIALHSNLQKGTIAIGTTETALRCFLLPVLKQFKKLYPNIHVRVASYNTLEAIAALKEGFVDFALITTPFELASTMSSYPLKRVQEVAVASESYAHLAHKSLSLSQLIQYPMITLSSKTKTYELYQKWFEKHQIPYHSDIEVATTDQILPLVLNDLGIGFVPEDFLLQSTKKLVLLNLKEELPHRYVCMIKNKEPLSLAALEMEKMMLQHKSQDF